MSEIKVKPNLPEKVNEFVKKVAGMEGNKWKIDSQKEVDLISLFLGDKNVGKINDENEDWGDTFENSQKILGDRDSEVRKELTKIRDDAQKEVSAKKLEEKENELRKNCREEILNVIDDIKKVGPQKNSKKNIDTATEARILEDELIKSNAYNLTPAEKEYVKFLINKNNNSAELEPEQTNPVLPNGQPCPETNEPTQDKTQQTHNTDKQVDKENRSESHKTKQQVDKKNPPKSKAKPKVVISAQAREDGNAIADNMKPKEKLVIEALPGTKTERRNSLDGLTKTNVYSFLSKYAANNQRHLTIMQDLNHLVGKKYALDYAVKIINRFLTQAKPFENSEEYKQLANELTRLNGAYNNNPDDGFNGSLAAQIDSKITKLMNLIARNSVDIQ